ncbi:MAG: hypothetical protein KBC73_06235 [Burkholderiaceae bacterium]|nr:hypothetical protein [Burkholderiaceae bacterium]
MSLNGKNPGLADGEAVQLARAHLEGLGLAAELAGRGAIVTHDGTQTQVSFTLAAGRRGGDISVTLDARGRVTGQRFER